MATLAYVVIIGWFLLNVIANIWGLGQTIVMTPGKIIFQVVVYSILIFLLFQI